MQVEIAAAMTRAIGSLQTQKMIPQYHPMNPPNHSPQSTKDYAATLNSNQGSTDRDSHCNPRLPLSRKFLLSVQGMNPGIENQRWKITDLREEISSLPLHTPFFILTETHLKSYHMDAEIAINDYSCHRADRVNRIRGGTSI